MAIPNDRARILRDQLDQHQAELERLDSEIAAIHAAADVEIAARVAKQDAVKASATRIVGELRKMGCGTLTERPSVKSDAPLSPD
jgi:cation transport ATPase